MGPIDKTKLFFSFFFFYRPTTLFFSLISFSFFFSLLQQNNILFITIDSLFDGNETKDLFGMQAQTTVFNV